MSLGVLDIWCRSQAFIYIVMWSISFQPPLPLRAANLLQTGPAGQHANYCATTAPIKNLSIN